MHVDATCSHGAFIDVVAPRLGRRRTAQNTKIASPAARTRATVRRVWRALYRGMRPLDADGKAQLQREVECARLLQHVAAAQRVNNVTPAAGGGNMSDSGEIGGI